MAANSVSAAKIAHEPKGFSVRPPGWSGLHLRISESALLAAAITILAVLSIVRILEWRRVADARIGAENAESALRTIEQLGKELLDAEIEEREYLLTGNDRDLREINAAIQAFSEQIIAFQNAAKAAGTSYLETEQLSDLANQRIRQVRSDLAQLQTQNRTQVMARMQGDARERLLVRERLLQDRLSKQYLATTAAELDVIQKLNHASLIEFSAGICCVLLIIVGTALRLNEAFGRQNRLVSELFESEKRYRLLIERLERVREDERARLAREIHDELGQALTGIKMDLGALNHRLQNGEASRALDKIRETSTAVDETIRSLQRIATELRPAILDHLGLVAAIEWLGKEFQTRSGVTVKAELPEDEPSLNGDERTCFFRILQEAFTNVARHANARSVHVTLYNERDDLVLSIRDDGVGFCLNSRSAASVGLAGMRERARLINAEMELQTDKGKGTTVSVRLHRSTEAAAQLQGATV